MCVCVCVCVCARACVLCVLFILPFGPKVVFMVKTFVKLSSLNKNGIHP